ncbi:MAG TPA: LysM peptidoglycan-binding domain-containing protein [Dehalococcoidia bacterium]|nr:LysM peptidoglycan-binding domain-containing protein [Dehalococcoidia bacterium]
MSSDDELTPEGAVDASVACPYLGLFEDADSHATFATEAHRCYRLPNPTRIAAGHQDTYCLNENHVSCPVYIGEVAGEPQAAAAAQSGTAAAASGDRAAASAGSSGSGGGQLGPRPRPGGIPIPLLTLGVLVLAAIVLGLAIWIQNLGGDDGDSLSPTDTVRTQTALRTQQAETAQPSDTQTVEPTQNTTPAATSTTAAPTATEPSSEETYTVVTGDTCIGIANTHGIEVEELYALNELNSDLCRGLEIGRILVIR